MAFDFEISHDGQLLVLALRDIPALSSPGKGKVYKQQVQVWSIQTRKRICDFEGAQPALFTPDGNMIVAGNANQEGNVDLRDAKTCQILYAIYPQGQKGPFSMEFSPDGQLLAIGGNETFQIWDVINRKLLFESSQLQNHVNILAFSPDGRFLLSKTDRTSVDDKTVITLWGTDQ